MKKIIIFLIAACMLFTVLSKLNTNNIKEIGIDTNSNKAPIINIKSDYTDNYKTVKQNDRSVYFDIQNAKLTDNYKISYSADLSVATQQIGRKVRVYLRGENISGAGLIFTSEKGVNTTDYNSLALLCGILAFVSVLAQKSYSATMRMKRRTTSVKSPIQTAMTLNRQLSEAGRKKPEIALRQATNPIHTEVYDFQFAKNRKNTKIAI